MRSGDVHAPASLYGQYYTSLEREDAYLDIYLRYKANNHLFSYPVKDYLFCRNCHSDTTLPNQWDKSIISTLEQ